MDDNKPQYSPEEIEEFKKRHIKSYVRRRGHISPAQQRALDELLPTLQIVYDSQTTLNYSDIFSRHAPTVLEIGCGMGETTAAIAKAHPEINFIGCEVYPAGVGALAKRLVEGEIENVKIIQHDAVEIVRDMIPDNSLDGIHIYFPDPWRKARHHKRRLVAQPFIGLLTGKLKIGGYIHCATDWENYSEQMLEVLEGEPKLENLHGKGHFSPVMANPLCDRPCTKFQARGERLGHGIWDLIFIRK